MAKLVVILLLLVSPVKADEEGAAPYSGLSKVAEVLVNKSIRPATYKRLAELVTKGYFEVAGNSPSLLWLERSKYVENLPDFNEFLSRLAKQPALFSDGSSQSSEAVWAAVLESLPKNYWAVRLEDNAGAEFYDRIHSNQYVGFGFTRGAQNRDGYIPLREIIPDSAADRAGMQVGDIILTVDGEDTKFLGNHHVLRSLLGAEGTECRICLRNKQQEVYEVNLVREKVFYPSVTFKPLNQVQDYIAHVTFSRFASSSVDELRQIETQIIEAGYEGVLISFQEHRFGRLHDAVMIANALKDGGPIGRAHSAGQVIDYVAESGRLFESLPVGVLPGQTSNATRWVANALHREGSVMVFAGHWKYRSYVLEVVKVPDTEYSLHLPTIVLEAPTDSKHSGMLIVDTPFTQCVAALEAEIERRRASK